MIDVLLAHSYYLKYDAKQAEKMRPYPPLATLYAASVLREAGYSVALFDAMLSEGEHAFEAALQQYQPRFVAIYEDSFNFLVKMCLIRMRAAAHRMSEAARDMGATVIAAGPDVSDHPDLYLARGAHYAILGEADHTLRALLGLLSGRQGRYLMEIAGLDWSNPHAPEGVFRTARRLPERHIDAFPMPAWDLLDVERYRAAWKQAHGYFSLNMVTTRGCPYHCNWCAKPIWGQHYAMRSPDCVAAEMAYLKTTLQPDHIWFADDIFGLRPQWVVEFGKEVQARDAKLPFTIQSRADRMTEEAVAALAQAGCREVWLGAERAARKILDAMEKGLQVAEVAAARSRLKAARIDVGFFLQFCYPGETFEDILATAQMVRDCLPDSIGISVSYPLPGTAFHEMVKAQLGSKTNWVDSGDLAMMFQGTYRSAFYRHLHQVLHRDLDLRRRLASGSPDAEALQALDRLNADWLEMGRLEAQARSATPTQIVRRNGHTSTPDLSKEWS